MLEMMKLTSLHCKFLDKAAVLCSNQFNDDVLNHNVLNRKRGREKVNLLSATILLFSILQNSRKNENSLQTLIVTNGCSFV